MVAFLINVANYTGGPLWWTPYLMIFNVKLFQEKLFPDKPSRGKPFLNMFMTRKIYTDMMILIMIN